MLLLGPVSTKDLAPQFCVYFVNKGTGFMAALSFQECQSQRCRICKNSHHTLLHKDNSSQVRHWRQSLPNAQSHNQSQTTSNPILHNTAYLDNQPSNTQLNSSTTNLIPSSQQGPSNTVLSTHANSEVNPEIVYARALHDSCRTTSLITGS